MKTFKASVLVLVIISQVCYVKYIIIDGHRYRQSAAKSVKHNDPPTGYRILTDGNRWVWERENGIAGWFRELDDQATKQDAIDSAWNQEMYSHFAATNVWRVDK